MSKLRDAARDQGCTVRLPGICNFDPATTILAHYRLSCGVGMKPVDLCGAHCCSSCHDAIDGRSKTAFTSEQLDLMHLEGVARTLERIVKKGLVKC